MYTTESDIDHQHGVIGVYDVRAGYRRVAEFSNGGIATHPVSARGASR